jgi:23S rRNA pseudouridine1911/1915/1917 synthase
VTAKKQKTSETLPVRFIVSEAEANERLDRFLQKKLGEFSRTDIQKLIAENRVTVAGDAAKKNLRLSEGLAVLVTALPEKEASMLKPEKMDLNIVYEDEDVAVIFKPRGVVVHPGNGVSTGTLAAGLLYHFKNELSTVNGPMRPGIVHRLDKDTPGLMIVAKNDKAHRNLAHQLETRTLHRKYEALIWGHPRDLSGEIELPVGRDPKSRIRMAVVRNGKFARTRYVAKKFFSIATLMEYELDTGRTHQIRVHSRYTGHPIVGDPVYEGREASLLRVPPLFRETAEKLLHLAPAQLLEAVEIAFVHPRTRKKMRFSVPLEKPFAAAVKLLEKECPESAPTFDEDTSFRNFDETSIENPYLEEPPETEEECPYEEEPVKERLTRAERLAMKKERIKKRKAIEAEKREKKAKREAEKRGEVYRSEIVTGHEPTIDPSYLE